MALNIEFFLIISILVDTSFQIQPHTRLFNSIDVSNSGFGGARLNDKNYASDKLFTLWQPTKTGTVVFGNFDQCLEKDTKKFCWILLANNNESRQQWNSCKTNQNERNFSSMAVGMCLDQDEGHCNGTIVDFCQTQSNFVDVGASLELILFLAVVLLLILLGTLIHFLPNNTVNWCPDFLVRFLRCFDLMDNFRSLFSIESKSQPTGPVNLDILNGFRILAIIWVIVAHCSGFTHMPLLMRISPFANFPNDLVRISQKYWIISAYLLNTYYAVTIFFLTSGILSGYQTVIRDRCNLFVHAFQHISKRWFRIAPLYLVTIFLTYQLRYLGSGPLFHQDLIRPFVEPCRNRIWEHLFFVQNFLGIEQRCGSHTWYLAADFQLHVVAFILVHLCRCRNAQLPAFILGSMLVLMSYSVPLIASFFNLAQLPDFQSLLDPVRHSNRSLDFILFYYGTHMHLDTFLFGWALGYLLSQEYLSVYWSMLTEYKLACRISMTISVGACLLFPVLVRFLFILGPQNNFYRVTLFLMLSLGFKLSLLSTIFIATIRSVSLLSRVMSSAITRPFARLVFGAYLSHQAYIWFLLQQQRTPFHLNFVTMATFILTILGLAFITAILMNVTIEQPTRRIRELIFSSSIDRSIETRQTIELVVIE